MPKRLIVCCDGTWNTVDQDHPTNVVKMARAIAAAGPREPAEGEGAGSIHQVVHYNEGVGTRWGLDRLTGGAFGHGLDKNIEDAYLFLLHNYEEGDRIYLFGFSRGAFTVRSLAGLMRNCGLLRKLHADRFRAALDLYRRRDAHPDSDEAISFRNTYSREVEVHFLGVWDTVGALGIPLRGLRFLTRRRYQFHDVELSGKVRNGYHALAIDERRGPFRPSVWAYKPKEGQSIEQVWFAGVHANVGGGYADAGLSDLAFMWMKEKAEACGLAFDEEYITGAVHPDPAGRIYDSKVGFYRFTIGHTRHLGEGSGAGQAVHASAVQRFHDDASYRPRNLAAYLERPGHAVAASAPPRPA